MTRNPILKISKSLLSLSSALIYMIILCRLPRQIRANKTFALVITFAVLNFLFLSLYTHRVNSVREVPDIKETIIQTCDYTLPRSSVPWASRTKKVNGHYPNTLSLQSPVFLEDYKNPCWKEKTDWGEKTRCLPYFLLAGMAKCGTSDLWHSLTKHPRVKALKWKEPDWWGVYQFEQGSTIEDYIKGFDEYAYTLRRVTSRKHGQKYHPMILGDGSHTTLWKHHYWKNLPENCNSSKAPTVLNPDLIHHIIPKVKIIIMLRNPADRMYSGYLFWGKDYPIRSPEHFHQQLVKSIAVWNNCTKTHGVRYCAYSAVDDISVNDEKIHFQLNMYHIYIKDWLKVFPREQFLFLKFEEYIQDIDATMEGVFEFLELDAPPSGYTMNNRTPRNQRASNVKKVGPMLQKSRDLLREFNKPYYEELVQILGDEKYRYDDL